MERQAPLVRRDGYGSGTYRRRIRLAALDERTVRGELVDDFHHFAATIVHDGDVVVDATGEAVRWPWTTCPGAVGAVTQLRGVPLDVRGTSVASHVDVSSQCTHLFDVAVLAVAHAAAGRRHRHYAADVGDRVHGRATATLDRDGERVLTWTVGFDDVLDPPPFAGRSLRSGFLRWAEAELAPDEAEAVIVLRRAVMISVGRMLDMDEVDVVTELGAGPPLGTCHTFNAARVDVAFRNRGSALDFTDHPDALLD